MTDISIVLSTIEKIRKHCSTLDALRQEQDAAYKREEAELVQTANAMNQQMRNSYEAYRKAHLGRLTDEITALADLLCRDYSGAYSAAPQSNINYANNTEDGNRETLYGLIDKINGCVGELNATDFNALCPPEKLSLNEAAFTFTGTKGDKVTEYSYQSSQRTAKDDPKPLQELATRLSTYCKEALSCLEAMEAQVFNRFNMNGFATYVDQCKAQRLGELTTQLQQVYDNRFNQLMVDETDQAVPATFFERLSKEGLENEVNGTVLPTGYRSGITIGDLRLEVTDKKDVHIPYFRNTPQLKRHLADGDLVAPLILDLKKCGNILLNVDEEIFSDQTCAFCHQIIMQFLLSFPANRINFCLVDIENRMNLSPYNKLTMINTGILGSNGIVRDDRQLENTIKDMEQTMYKIDDNILSYNSVNNIFEYNEKYEANPQSLHLFVLVNYPAGIRDDIAKRVSKILQSGTKAGIFTLIINNKSCSLNPSYKPAEHQQFLETAARHAVVINKEGNRFKLGIQHKNQFVPRNTLSVDQLPGLVDSLKYESEKKSQVVIPLDKMFADTDAALASPRGIPSSAAVLDIPIGARGGEVQNLLLKTTGDGSAHAVVIGGTGSGKSNLLHAIILSACYKYSPEELNLYIVDFKGGVEFEYYEAGKVREKQIPHIKLTGLTSDLEDGVSILANLHKELRRREEEFKRNQVEDITQYRALGKKLPRLFVIIDEIQELFEQDDRLGQKAIDILRELFKKGRAFGINILWASQNVPKTPGLKDKVLSQIGNRISLRLNEPDDALDIKIDPKVVRNLNRPEKGLGVINDIRYGNDSIEFRVAYAESSANRQKYSQMIVDKWRSVTEQMPSEPLYIVGDDAEPSPMGENTIYSAIPTAASVVSKAFEHYTLQLGQDYVTGKPFNVDLTMMENKMNMLMVGHDTEILRDGMGYSLLSIVLNQLTNADCRGKQVKIHCANGEIITPKNAGDLFNIIREDFAPVIQNVSKATALSDCIRDVYKIYKERAMESENSEVAQAYAPEFVVIHSLQRYVDLLMENPVLQLQETQSVQAAPTEAASTQNKLEAALALFGETKASAPAPAAGKSGMPQAIALCNALKELLDRGGKYNIHFVISVDDPTAIASIKTELCSAAYKVFGKGVHSNVLSQLLGDYKVANSLTNPKVAMVCFQDERTKVRMYRYETETDQGWYQQLRATYQPLVEEMQ